jgi:RimJ/RimL family protein N-acetyltransferase
MVRWRNENTRYFASQGTVTVAGHAAWWRRYQADPWDHMYMILAGGKPAGTIGARIGPGPGEIQRVLLGDKSLRRSGVMTAALDLVMSAYGVRIWKVRVLGGNKAAFRFYETNGFRVSGRDGECVVMTR